MTSEHLRVLVLICQLSAYHSIDCMQ